VIAAAGGTPAALAAKAATQTIPIVFAVSVDPVEIRLIASLNQPGGNMTGITNLNVEVGPKRLELLRELLPTATNVALLLNPTSPSITDAFLRTLQPGARAIGLQLHVLHAASDRDFDPVFERLVQLRVDALVISPDVFFNTAANSLPGWRFAMGSRQSTSIARLLRPAVSSAMEATRPNITVWSASTPAEFSRETSPVTCRSNSPPKLN
jgi:ABC-type uncharacterized transport system substrate-binding protein